MRALSIKRAHHRVDDVFHGGDIFCYQPKALCVVSTAETPLWFRDHSHGLGIILGGELGLLSVVTLAFLSQLAG